MDGVGWLSPEDEGVDHAVVSNAACREVRLARRSNTGGDFRGWRHRRANDHRDQGLRTRNGRVLSLSKYGSRT